MDLVFIITFNDLSMSIGCVGKLGHLSGYRPRSEGDDLLGGVRPSVCLCALSCLTRLTYDIDIWYVGRP